jgi:PAS domain S-box-containing protein
MLVLSVFAEIFIAFQLEGVAVHIRHVLQLLMHCSPEIVLSTPKIMKVLSGDFTLPKADTVNQDSEFFHTVFMNLPDAIIRTGSDLIIQEVNHSGKRLFADVDLIGQNIRTFFLSGKLSGQADTLFAAAGSNPMASLIYRRSDGNVVHLEATSGIPNGVPFVTCRDVTQTVRYNNLIREERGKCDQLLANILPPSLVRKVQDGEADISFSVQSASILFLDIVGFTPWCGSLPAATVMSTLNAMFTRFDACLATKPTMTKIKCIGDCYMAAGGIFAEVNQPAEHARDVVAFGLDAIRALVDLNKEMEERLQVRVGVNTGGPVVAGVVGVGKPTFEILGSAINLAQEMEHTGIPMLVHVTRAVYELIYGMAFTIRERQAEVTTRQGQVTYLVSNKE